MSGHSRRSFLVTAGASAAVGAGALMTTAGAAGGSTWEDDVDSSDTIVAYVKDPATGQITLMTAGHEVEITDKALARALARKAV